MSKIIEFFKTAAAGDIIRACLSIVLIIGVLIMLFWSRLKKVGEFIHNDPEITRAVLLLLGVVFWVVVMYKLHLLW